MTDINPEVTSCAEAMGVSVDDLHQLQELQNLYMEALRYVPVDQWAASIPIQLAIGQLKARGRDPRELLHMVEHWVEVELNRSEQ